MLLHTRLGALVRNAQRPLSLPLPVWPGELAITARHVRVTYRPSPAGWWRAAWWSGAATRGFAYAESTRRRKQALALPTDRVTLFHTGQFYTTLQVFTARNTIVIRSRLPYSDYLVKRYGDIFQLPDAYWSEFIRRMREDIAQNIVDTWLRSE